MPTSRDENDAKEDEVGSRHRSRHSSRRRHRSRSDSRSRSGSRRSRSRSDSRERRRHKKHKKKHKKHHRKEHSPSPNSEDGLTPEQVEQKHELERLTRDARTIFVSQLQVKVDEFELRKFFERVCKVKDTVLIRDRYSNKSKGYGYVELRALEDVPKALLLTGTNFVFPNGKESFPVLVKASEAEKNFTHMMEKRANTATATYTINHANSTSTDIPLRDNPVLKEPWNDKIEIRNLNASLEAEHVKMFCETIGPVIGLDLVPDYDSSKSDRPSSVCYVQFESPNDAKTALKELDNMKLAESRIKVRPMLKGQVSKLEGTSQSDINKLLGLESLTETDLTRSLAAYTSVTQPRPPKNEPNDNINGNGERNTNSSINVQSSQSQVTSVGGGQVIAANFSTNQWRLEADDSNAGQYGGQGIALSAGQKMQLMSRLAGGAASQILMSQPTPYINTHPNTQTAAHTNKATGMKSSLDSGSVGAVKGVASKFLCVKNLFTKTDLVSDPSLYSELKGEVVEEVSKTGKCQQVFVQSIDNFEAEQEAGKVFLQLETIQQAVDTAIALHGRWFAKRIVQVEYLKKEDFEKATKNL